MLVNANIKSKKELAQRLIDGEVFYNKYGYKIYFDEQLGFPFRFNDVDAPSVESVPVESSWSEYLSLLKEVNWWDNIPEEGIPCWVSDCDENPSKVAARIIGICKGEYVSIAGSTWAYAIPVLPEECLQSV